MLDNPVLVEIRLLNCSRDQACELIVVESAHIGHLGPSKSAPFDLDEMAHEARRCNSRVDANDKRVGSLLAAFHAHGFSRPIEREHDRRAFARIIKLEYELGESIQSDSNLPHGDDKLMRARVVRVGRNSAWVVQDNEETPRLASLRRKDENMQSMLLPGDLVDVRPHEDGTVVVDRVEPRTFELERRTVKGRTKSMAANVDTIAIVAAMVEPPIRLSMVDQLIAFAELQERSALVLLTKVDLTDGTDASRILELYRSLGYRAFELQPKLNAGIELLRSALGDAHGLLVGQSGVGKSSIYRALGGATEVGEVSRFGRGRQTTTAARLLRLGSGFLIDSPGVGAFELGDVTSAEMTRAFVEFEPLASECRFRDCAHMAEPGCAVRRAVDDGRVALSRYDSYRLILDRADPLSNYS
jgi:ribosome biogenesis GTPase